MCEGIDSINLQCKNNRIDWIDVTKGIAII